jgi:3-oxoacyl-[acyl-carrier protein] reductase
VGRLEERVAIITGAGRGIGAGTARLFAAHGARVVLNDVDEAPVRDVAEAIVADGGQAEVHVGDCGQAAVAAGIVETAVTTYGGLDIVVNNAGTTADAPFHGMDEAQWDAVQSAALQTAVATTRAAVAVLREQATAELARDGHVAHHRKITNTVAAAFLTGNPGQANLSAAGGAVAGLTRTLARELGGFGVNVNAVAPGFVETRLTAPQLPDGGLGVAEPLRQMIKATTALGRYGTPDDVARVHLFLASPDADFVTGTVIPVTGGLLGT